MRPTEKRGAMIKIRAVVDIANRDPKWAKELDNDPEGAVRRAGIDLTDNEIQTITDIVSGTNASIYATPPAGQEDKYPELRDLWSKVKARL